MSAATEMQTPPESEERMTIAIIGAGRVGQSLARALTAKRYRVRFGVPDPGRHGSLAARFRGMVTVGTVSDAIGPVTVVIMATPYAAALQVARDVGDWGDRILVDATNPIAPGMDGLLVGTVTSGAQQIALQAHGARVVKAFNSTGFENLADPQGPGGSLFMPVAGDDAEARHKVIALATLIGFDAVDLGSLAAARYIEPWAMVWIEMAMRLGHGRRFGFICRRQQHGKQNV
jgi:8-hydroxy-5-deazaflavin:NADPH oxidoreductase